MRVELIFVNGLWGVFSRKVAMLLALGVPPVLQLKLTVLLVYF